MTVLGDLITLVDAAFTRVGTEFNTLRTERRARVATTANIALTGTQTIDGVAVVAGDLVLVRAQTTASQNGLYTCAAGAWSRATRFNTAAKLAAVRIEVTSGTVMGGTTWRTNFKATDTLGSTAVGWQYIGDLPGTIKAWGGNVLPEGWSWCNGAGINKTNYPAYDFWVGAAYGGDATTNYVPTMNDVLNGRTLRYGPPGSSGGGDTVSLTANNLPTHTHPIDHNHAAATTTSDSHSHTMVVRYTTTTTATNNLVRVTDVGNSGSGGGGTTGSGTTSVDAHTHTLDLPNFTGTSGANTTTHDDVDVTNSFASAYYIIKIAA